MKEEFSVSELWSFRENLWMDNTEAVNDLLMWNIATSDSREKRREASKSEIDADRAVSMLLHDASVSVYELNTSMEFDGFIDRLCSEVRGVINDSDDLSLDLTCDEVYGLSVEQALEQLADYYSENFSEASEVEIERVIENNGFFGRADIIRDTGEEIEMRDVKTRYSDKRPFPSEEDRFKMTCYALISRGEIDVDRFVLEYPLQGKEVEIDPESDLVEVANLADEYRERLEEVRSREVEIIEELTKTECDGSPREFVEGLNLGYQNWDYARLAVEATND